LHRQYKDLYCINLLKRIVAMASLTYISDFLGLRKSTVGLLCMVILVGMGERMALNTLFSGVKLLL